MKTNNILIVALGFILLMNTSCGLGDESDRCEGDDILLDKLTFESATNIIVSDPETMQSLIFENELGNTIKLNEFSETDGDYQLKVEAICGYMNAVYSKNVYAYYEGYGKTIEYKDQNEGVLHFVKSIRLADEFLPEVFLYDRIYIYAKFKDTNFGAIHLISSVRGKESSFPQNYLEESNSYEFDASIELGGIVYKNVYSSVKTAESINGTIYLTKEAGVIGLLDKDEVFWKLKL